MQYTEVCDTRLVKLFDPKIVPEEACFDLSPADFADCVFSAHEARKTAHSQKA